MTTEITILMPVFLCQQKKSVPTDNNYRRAYAFCLVIDATELFTKRLQLYLNQQVDKFKQVQKQVGAPIPQRLCLRCLALFFLTLPDGHIVLRCDLLEKASFQYELTFNSRLKGGPNIPRVHASGSFCSIAEYTFRLCQISQLYMIELNRYWTFAIRTSRSSITHIVTFPLQVQVFVFIRKERFYSPISHT